MTRLKQPLHRHFAACLHAKWLIMEGRFPEAETRARRGYTEGRRAQGTHVGLLYGGQLFAIRHNQGRLGQLIDELRPTLDLDRLSLPIWRAGLILARWERGERKRAREELRAMVEGGFASLPRDMFWLGAICLLAEGAAAAGDALAAAEIIGRLEPVASCNAQVGLALVLGPIAGFIAPLAALVGESDLASRHFQAALERSAILNAWTIEARSAATMAASSPHASTGPRAIVLASC